MCLELPSHFNLEPCKLVPLEFQLLLRVFDVMRGRIDQGLCAVHDGFLKLHTLLLVVFNFFNRRNLLLLAKLGSLGRGLLGDCPVLFDQRIAALLQIALVGPALALSLSLYPSDISVISVCVMRACDEGGGMEGKAIIVM